MRLPVVFLGPTLDAADARAVADVEVLPPARRGDVIRVLEHGVPPAIGLVDGFFHGTPAVWHKELLTALGAGVRVYGAASMGALRAVELEPHGMVAVGEVAAAYRSGRWAADDAVAVLHEPADRGWRRLTEALVDLVDCHEAALSAGVIEATIAARLGGIASGLHYTDRSRDAVTAAALAAGVPHDTLDRLARFAATHRAVKARDAVALLERMSADVAAAGGRRVAPPPVRVARTTFLLQLVAEIRREIRPYGHVEF